MRKQVALDYQKMQETCHFDEDDGNESLRQPKNSIMDDSMYQSEKAICDLAAVQGRFS